jgi:hypothetical protein
MRPKNIAHDKVSNYFNPIKYNIGTTLWRELIIEKSDKRALKRQLRI